MATIGGSRPSYVGAIVFSILGTVCGLCFGSLILFCNGLMVTLVAFACHIQETRRRTFIGGSVIATALTYVGVIVLVAMPQQRKWAELQKSYPVESLTERLRYEQSAMRRAANARPAKQELNSPRLETFENHLQGHRWDVLRRDISLQHLHSSSVERFIDSQGFGIGRMAITPSPSHVELPEPEPISVPVYPDGSVSPSASADAGSRDTGREDTQRGADLHEDSLLSFFDPRGFGYVQDRDHVVGFQPHAFSRAPQVASKWWIDRLELVSLLKHEEPAVYLSEHLPRMQELRDAETRPLDSFEQEALAALRGGEELYKKSTPGQIRMLGAIRAVRQCLKCHSAERGDLLGAFSYDLRREP
jgi:hypothetical protein